MEEGFFVVARRVERLTGLAVDELLAAERHQEQVGPGPLGRNRLLVNAADRAGWGT